jgi:hypothetical protein
MQTLIRIYDYVTERLDASRGRWTDVAQATGISPRTIEKIGYRVVKDPGVKVTQRLAEHFWQAERDTAKPAGPQS